MFKRWLQRIGTILVLSASIFITSYFIVSNAFATSLVTLISCDESGNTNSTSDLFNQATITISNLDTSGNYMYYGADVGVFELPVNNLASTIYTKRVITNSLSIEITDFGYLSGYEQGKVYVLAYRVLYQPIGDNGGNIVESSWKMVPDTYFKKASTDPFITTDSFGEIRPDDKTFSQADIKINDLDTSGNYNYYGADVGVFKAPDNLNISETITTGRIVTNNLNLQIDDFGSLSNYEYNHVYVLGYRVLYQPIGDNGLNIVESSWKMVPDSYFRLVPKNVYHVQTIRYYYGQLKTVDVKEPDNPGLQGDELAAYNDWSFATENDRLRYKIKFDVSNPDMLEDVNVNLLLNNLKDPDVELVPIQAQINGIEINLANAKQPDGSYVLKLPVGILTQGENLLTYIVQVHLNNYSNSFANISSNATVFEGYRDGTSLQIGTPFSQNSSVIARVYKGRIALE